MIPSCEHAGVCSGCPWIDVPYEEQLAKKAQGVTFRSAGQTAVRDRVDLVLKNGNLGFYRNPDLGPRAIVAVGACPQMTPALAEWFAAFKRELPPVEAGSLRLRVSPDGERGAWLDFSNVDIARLLAQGTYLRGLAAQAVVEIGQRRKRLVERDGVLKLGPPEPRPWFETYLAGKPKKLYGAIGGFSQVGFRVNRLLVETLVSLFPEGPLGRWVELGAGSGNLTLPLAHAGAVVDAVENDPLAAEGLKKAAAEAAVTVRVHALNFQHPGPPLAALLDGADGLLVDPPRSGLQNAIDCLTRLANKPRHLLYVSCSPETFASDAEKLRELGYVVEAKVGVDQFPNSPHAELVARLAMTMPN